MPETVGNKQARAQESVQSERLAESRFLRACRRQPVDRTPIWLMRQAGRFLPDFRAIRAKVSFLDLCKNAELACEVTMMPVEQLGVDAAIIFADILLPLEPLGVGLEYAKGEGPVIHRPVRTPEDVVALRPFNIQDELGYVMNAIALTRKALPDNVPLIGFAGAPFTLASYMIQGGSSRHFEKTKHFMYTQPAAWEALMRRISEMTARYLLAQIKAGAQVVQLFDSWVGCLSPSDYARFVMPYSKDVIDTVSGAAPFIHFGTGTPGLLLLMAQAGGDVIGIDWRIGLDTAWNIVGHGKAVQGNLDPIVLLSNREEIELQANRILDEAAGCPGHIFNLGHGVLPPTEPDNVRFLIDLVHSRELRSNER